MNDWRNETDVVGWIPQAVEQAPAGNEYRELAAFSPDELDADNLRYFREYAGKHFNGPFVEGWGTEQILDALAHYARGGRWLDAGAGTTTLFWSIPIASVESIMCVDVVPEALHVLRDMTKLDDVPQCYRDVLARYGRDVGHLEEMARRIDTYAVFDVSRPWPEEMAEETFDIITAIGVFGLSGTAEGFRESVRHAAAHLAIGGCVIGTNWRRAPAFIRSSGLDTSFMTPDFVAQSLEAAGLAVPHVCEVRLPETDAYEAVIVWVGARG